MTEQYSNPVESPKSGAFLDFMLLILKILHASDSHMGSIVYFLYLRVYGKSNS